MSPTLTSIAMLLSLVLAPPPTGVGAPPSDAESPLPLSPSDPSAVVPIPPALEPSPVAAYCAGCGGGCDFDAGSSCAPAGVYGMDACSTDIINRDYSFTRDQAHDHRTVHHDSRERDGSSWVSS